MKNDRRRFLKDLAGSAALLSSLPAEAFANATSESAQQASGSPKAATPRIKFAVIGINHSHINSQVEAVIRGGGELTSVYAKEADLLAGFTKRFPQAKVARARERDPGGLERAAGIERRHSGRAGAAGHSRDAARQGLHG